MGDEGIDLLPFYPQSKPLCVERDTESNVYLLEKVVEQFKLLQPLLSMNPK